LPTIEGRRLLPSKDEGMNTFCTMGID